VLTGMALLVTSGLATTASAVAAVPLCNGLPAMIAGNMGTPFPDVINGFEDNDIICGRGGNDTINAGVGPDRVFAVRSASRPLVVPVRCPGRATQGLVALVVRLLLVAQRSRYREEFGGELLPYRHLAAHLTQRPEKTSVSCLTRSYGALFTSRAICNHSASTRSTGRVHRRCVARR